MSKPTPSQPTLFAIPEQPLGAAPADPAHVALAAQLPNSVRLGTMSWSYPGWRNLVYGAEADPKQLAERGLTAYAQHPLLTTVEIDRSYYDPLSAATLREYAEQVPSQFRFVVKAHEALVLRRFPGHARYGRRRGEANALYLDATYATERVIGPVREGLGEKLGVLLFQFPPQDAGGPTAFAAELQAFFAKLPRGVAYAVELRNRELFTPLYARALLDTGALHCHNVWGEMPSVLVQARSLPASTRRPLVVRWLMRRGDAYQSAGERYMPFDRIVDEDPANRDEIARLVARATQHGVSAYVLLDNKAEGCAPASALKLAGAIVQECTRSA